MEGITDKEPPARKRSVHDWYMGLCPMGSRGTFPSLAEETWWQKQRFGSWEGPSRNPY